MKAFLHLFQESVNSDAEPSPNHATQTKTSVREDNDVDEQTQSSCSTLGTRTITETREEPDEDKYQCAHSVGTKTVTRSREEESDTDFHSDSHLVSVRGDAEGVGTGTHTKARENPDQDPGNVTFLGNMAARAIDSK